LIIGELRGESASDVMSPNEIIAIFQKLDGSTIRSYSAAVDVLPHKLAPASVGSLWDEASLSGFHKFRNDLTSLDGCAYARSHFAAIVFDACSSIASSLFVHNRILDFPENPGEEPTAVVKNFRSVVWMSWRALVSEYELDGCCFALVELLDRFRLESMVLLCECCLDLLDLDPPVLHSQKTETDQPIMLWQTLVDVIKLIESDSAAGCARNCLLRRDWVLLNFRVVSQSLTSMIYDVAPSPLLQDALVGKSDSFCLPYLASRMRSLSEASLEQFGKGWPVENAIKQLNDMTSSQLLSDLSPESLPSSDKLEEWITSALHVYDKFVHLDVMLFAINNTSEDVSRVAFKKSAGAIHFVLFERCGLIFNYCISRAGLCISLLALCSD
jgi:hypothetical protein